MANKKKKKNPVQSIQDAADKYKTYKGGSTDIFSDPLKFKEWKNAGLDDLMQAIKSRQASGGGRNEIGVYINKAQARKFADVVDYAKSLNINVGVAKVGTKNRPYDLKIGYDPVARQKMQEKIAAAKAGTTAVGGTEDFSAEIANKIVGSFTTSKKKKFQG
jgi:hypothetical protein